MTIAIEAEQSLLGAMMIDCAGVPVGVDTLRAGDFSDPVHAAVYSAALSLHERGEPVDVMTIRAEIGSTKLRAGWESYVASLTELVATSANAAHYARIVRKEARRRDMLKACARAFEQAKAEGADGDEIMQGLTAYLAQLAEGRELTRPVTMRELVRAEFKAIEHRHEHGEVVGLETGFPALDRLLSGLEPAGLVIIGGRPSMGKSTLATNIVENMALRGGKRGLIFSLEMTSEEQAQRSIASEARVDLHRIRTGRLTENDWPRLAAAIGRLDTDQVALVNKGGIGVAELRSIARQYHARHPVDVIVVDYLQLMEGASGDNREQEVASISRGLKALAMELRIPVIALSQLNRSVESRSDKRPLLSDLRESGALEQDASQVLFVYRDDFYNPKSQEPGVAEIGVAKNRNGPPGMVKLRWSGKFTRFDNMEAA